MRSRARLPKTMASTGPTIGAANRPAHATGDGGDGVALRAGDRVADLAPQPAPAGGAELGLVVEAPPALRAGPEPLSVGDEGWFLRRGSRVS
jgi:hypothetical protein